MAHFQIWSYNDLKTNSDNNLVMCRKGKHVYVKARVSMPMRQLSIPIQSKSISNLSAVTDDGEGNTIHPYAVDLVVSWLVSEQEALSGFEEDRH